MDADEVRSLLDEIRELESHDQPSVEDLRKAHAIDRRARKGLLQTLGTTNDVAGVPASSRTLGEALIKSADYQAAAAAFAAGEPHKFDSFVETKAVGDPVLEATGNNADAIAPTWFGLETPGYVQYPTRIQSVMNIVQVTNGNTANYPVATRAITDMTSTAETENKAGTEFTFDFAYATVEKFTAFASVSDEFFQDAPALVDYINTELSVMALQKEEKAIADALYLGSVTAADGTTIQTTPTGYDAILEAMTMVRVAGGVPNVILINPYDWATLATTRAVAGTGAYFSGGPYTAPLTGLWGGLTEVQTPVIPESTALVGDFTRGARLFRKGGARLESSNSHDTYFRQNLIAIRAEIRSVCKVTYPEFFVEVTVSS
jgi:HK97 family phage major capsid protein